MNEGFYLAFCRTNSPKSDISFLDEQTARSAEQFHRSFPQYTPTPLVTLDHLAKLFGVEKIYVKDESKRFDLNAFKVLGGSFAIGRYIAQRLGKNIDQLSFAAMTSPEVRAQLGELTFVTATDGNHGRGVAWTANKLGQKSVVYMPRGSAPERLQNIRTLGSDASITDLANLFGQHKPIITIVEPNRADCIFRTAKAADGKLHFVTEEMRTIMAGLACGEPCPIAWEVIRDYADFCLSIPDYAAARGIRILANPMEGDGRIISGESGASAFGGMSVILSDPQLCALKDQLHIDEHSRLLFISTEGATDRENWQHIVWDGKYPSC